MFKLSCHDFQKPFFSLKLPLVRLELNYQPAILVFNVEDIVYLTKGTLVDLPLEDKPILEQ